MLFRYSQAEASYLALRGQVGELRSGCRLPLVQLGSTIPGWSGSARRGAPVQNWLSTISQPCVRNESGVGTAMALYLAVVIGR